MLAELTEDQATGEIARIYGEIRETCAVPYVSSLQRHLATRPGWLEWSWGAVRPAFTNGLAQEAAWAAASRIDAPPLPALSGAALRVFGVDDAGRRAIAGVAELFVRAAPTNLMLSGLMRMLLAGERPNGSDAVAADGGWTPPEALSPPPALVHPNDLGKDARAVMMQFGTEVAGQPFVPGLYRMLGHWPVYMAHLATVLAPRFDDDATKAACAAVLERIDEAVPDVFARLPVLPDDVAMPPENEFAEVLAALGRYRQTSPEMIVFGTLIRDALPRA